MCSCLDRLLSRAKRRKVHPGCGPPFIHLVLAECSLLWGVDQSPLEDGQENRRLECSSSWQGVPGERPCHRDKEGSLPWKETFANTQSRGVISQ